MIQDETIIREIKKDDLEKGFLDTLDALVKTSGLGLDQAKQIFHQISSNPNHKIFVAEYNNKIVGSITLLVEQKFIHHGGVVSHIEDCVIAQDMQNKNIGKKLVTYALDYSKKQGCYKTILNCTDKIVGFYLKTGFKIKTQGMRYDHVK